MTADNDGLGPARDQTGDVRNDNGLAEDSSASGRRMLERQHPKKLRHTPEYSQDVSNGAIGRQPHCYKTLALIQTMNKGNRHTLLQLEFLHASLVRSDGGALDAHSILLDRLGGFDRDLVIGLVTVFKALIESY